MPTDGTTHSDPAMPLPMGRLLLLFALAFLAMCLAALALPHDRYIRYQQLDLSAMKPGIWVYERLHFDPNPIDIAFIGASRTEVAVSAPQLEAQLRAKLGRPVHVVNLSLPMDGRNLHYEIVRELLATHPEVKLIVFSLIEHASRTGHPGFRSVADLGDVVQAPLFGPEYLNNLAFLPYRQLSLFLQTQLPGMFGVHRAFEPRLYWGTDHDTTRSHWSALGNWIDRDAVHSAAELAKAAKGKISRRTPIFLPARYRDYEYAVERTYTRKIATLLRQRHVEMGFLYVPVYAHNYPISDLPFYRVRGFVLNAGPVADHSEDYSDYGHLNRIGTAKVSRWVAMRLAAKQDAGALNFLPAAESR